MRSGAITRSVGAGAILAAIATLGSFLAPGPVYWWAVAAAALRAAVLVGLGHDMAIHVGAWRMRWFAYAAAVLEVAFIVLTLLHIPVEAHMGVADAVPGASPQGVEVGFAVWLLYGLVTFALGVATVGAARYRAFGALTIGAGVAWLLVLGILLWPFIVAAALLALAYRLLRPSIAAAAG
jgi:hypothetical protein